MYAAYKFYALQDRDPGARAYRAYGRKNSSQEAVGHGGMRFILLDR